MCVCDTVCVDRDIYKHSLLTETMQLPKRTVFKNYIRDDPCLQLVKSVHCKSSERFFLLTQLSDLKA